LMSTLYYVFFGEAQLYLLFFVFLCTTMFLPGEEAQHKTTKPK